MIARMKMSPADRAKQFMPFAALKGYEVALRAKEKIVVEKSELSEDMAEEVDRKLHQIQKNDIITVVYYFRGEYLQVTGMVSRIDLSSKVLKVVNVKIPMTDIYTLY